MKVIRKRLNDAVERIGASDSPQDREWTYIPYDQLSGRIGTLSVRSPERCAIVLVECPLKAARRPYHKQ